MIDYQQFDLENGLKVIVHEDKSTPLAVVNITYNVGSRDEDPHKTGFAHLFEHLMFGGSKNIPNYDEPLQKVGGENNAFTNSDFTNYYLTIPAINLETAFWLESDRMLDLSFDPKSLDVQKKVVVEEFKQRYLNQPYGDVWLKLRPLVYKKHPYRWATIGKDIEHIEKAKMEDVKDFFRKFYVPNNAVMVVAGNVELDEVKELSEKWFGPISRGKVPERSLPEEPVQEGKRTLEIDGVVPLKAIYKAYHMPGRMSADFHVANLISDILGGGKSSRLYQSLVKDKQYFAEINSFVTASVDPGLLIISGKINENLNLEEAETQIDSIVKNLMRKVVKEDELTKVKNQAESALLYGEVELLNRAMNLSLFATMGDPDLVNKEVEMIQKITSSDIKKLAKRILKPENCSALYYNPVSKKG